MEYIFIYLLDILDNIKIAAAIILAIASVLIFLCGMDHLIRVEEGLDGCDKTTKAVLKIVSPIWLSMLLAVTFLPSTKTMAMMGGVYYGKKVVNNLCVEEKTQKVSKIIDLQLDKYIKELENARR